MYVNLPCNTKYQIIHCLVLKSISRHYYTRNNGRGSFSSLCRQFLNSLSYFFILHTISFSLNISRYSLFLPSRFWPQYFVRRGLAARRPCGARAPAIRARLAPTSAQRRGLRPRRARIFTATNITQIIVKKYIITTYYILTITNI